MVVEEKSLEKVINELLSKYTFRKDSKPSLFLSLQDYINVRKTTAGHKYPWLAIRSCWVTECGKTIWQLTHELQVIRGYDSVIGDDGMAPALFIQKIKEKLEKK